MPKGQSKIKKLWYNIQTCMLSHGINKPHPFSFGFNNILMACQLGMVKHQFQIIDHGFLQAHFKAEYNS